MRAAASGAPQCCGVFFDVADKDNRRDSRTTGLRDLVQHFFVPSCRHDPRCPHGESDQDGGGAISASCAVDDDGLARREPSARQSAIGHYAARNGRQLRQVAIVESFDGCHGLRREECVFGERAVLP